MQIDNKISLYTEQISKIDISINKYIQDKAYTIGENEKRSLEIESINNNIEQIKANISDLEKEINDIAHSNKNDKEKYDELNIVLITKNNELLSRN